MTPRSIDRIACPFVGVSSIPTRPQNGREKGGRLRGNRLWRRPVESGCRARPGYYFSWQTAVVHELLVMLPPRALMPVRVLSVLTTTFLSLSLSLIFLSMFVLPSVS